MTAHFHELNGRALPISANSMSVQMQDVRRVAVQSPNQQRNASRLPDQTAETIQCTTCGRWRLGTSTGMMPTHSHFFHHYNCRVAGPTRATCPACIVKRRKQQASRVARKSIHSERLLSENRRLKAETSSQTAEAERLQSMLAALQEPAAITDQSLRQLQSHTSDTAFSNQLVHTILRGFNATPQCTRQQLSAGYTDPQVPRLRSSVLSALLHAPAMLSHNHVPN